MRSLAAPEGRACLMVHTILEVYRAADLALLRVLGSVADEVNAAAFHPIPVRAHAVGSQCDTALHALPV